jgi:gamma-glutamyltranspeptidase/glutathione hydrolase
MRVKSRLPPKLRGLVLLLGWLIACAAHGQSEAPEQPSGWTPKKPVVSKHDMVVAANPFAVEAGYKMLREGGNAIDAAVAVQMVLNLVEPQSSGIGGGAFMLFHNGRNRVLTAYDGRETAPAAAKPDRFLGADGKPLQFFDAVVGGKSVGVPGTLRMLELAHRQYGRLPWAKLFEPAIALAERGFAVSPRLHSLIEADPYLRTQDRARAYFFNADGSPLAVGQTLKNAAFAATLQRIAAEGADPFYKGAIAADIVETVSSAATSRGDMTEADLAGYKVKVREPICGHYRAYKVCSAPLPAGGTTVLQILGILQPFDMSALRAGSLMSIHVFSEAGRLAYADRDQYLADPDFSAPPSRLTDPAYLRSRSALIRFDASMGRAKAGVPEAVRKAARVDFGADSAFELPSTSHLSIVDKYGNALAMTTSIEYAFGSQLMTPGGFLLNNELTDFSFSPVADGKPVANRVEAGKRPRSAMSPTIVYDAKGELFMVAGSVNGSQIINDVAKTLIGVIDWGLDPQAAADLPNVGSRNGPTELEKSTSAVALEPKLRALGHDTRVVVDTSGVHAIVRTRTGWIAGADPRREGTARGD